MTAYYNEFDSGAAAWLRQLIADGQIAPGIVDERSIEDVRPDELLGYTQCHFFAGIGGWSLALRLAGIPDDYPIWTGSCPCQPFSSAGAGGGLDDPRHLWPSFAWLIAQCRPAVVAGEQVASKATGPWFDLVQADLEAMGYAFGLAAFPAAGIGAPHIRDRAYWVADSRSERLPERVGNGRIQREALVSHAGQTAERHGDIGGVDNATGTRHQRQEQEPESQTRHKTRLRLPGAGYGQTGTGPAGPTNGQWRAADWLLCRDGKWRAVEPGTFPLVDGIPRGVVQSGDIVFPTAEARTVRLKGYGNAIVPQQAAEFVRATL